MKKGVLKNLAISTENSRLKTPVLGSRFNKVAGLQTSNFIKKRLQHRCFSVNTVKFSRMPILKDIYERLLLRSFLRTTLNIS